MLFNGLHMLPNLKILVCGVVFGLLLFAVTGAGVMLPDSHTRIGKMPEVSRPMMRQVIADEPAQVQFQVMSAARRSEELERLRERAASEVASASADPESDFAKPGAAENSVGDNALADAGEVPSLEPTRAIGTESGTASISIQTPVAEMRTDAAAEIRTEAAPEGADAVQIAALPPTSAGADLSEHKPSLAKVPLPPLRPSVAMTIIHRRVLHRKHVVAPARSESFGQSLFQEPPSWAR